jgi:dTDP-4-dehydrorhamnose 3,5-epimerase
MEIRNASHDHGHQEGSGLLKVERTVIDDVLVLEPEVFSDERGFFMESYNQRDFDAAVGACVRFVQDNHSRSSRGVLRGLHYQLAPHAQAKLVRVTLGAVFSVAVDLRKRSRHFGHWVGVELSDTNHRQLWLPPGMAHGFLAISDAAECLYKTTTFYVPEAERCVRWNDPTLAIDWPALDRPPMLSIRDATAPWLVDAAAVD